MIINDFKLTDNILFNKLKLNKNIDYKFKQEIKKNIKNYIV